MNCISASDVGDFVKSNEIMTASDFDPVCNNICLIGKFLIFQHDNSHKQTANAVKAYLDRKTLSVMDNIIIIIILLHTGLLVDLLDLKEHK